MFFRKVERTDSLLYCQPVCRGRGVTSFDAMMSSMSCHNMFTTGPLRSPTFSSVSMGLPLEPHSVHTL